MAHTGVEATFRIRGEVLHQFSSQPKQAAAEQIDNAGSDKNAYTYTGRHDHGDLPELRSGGPHEQLVHALLNAKADSDKVMTALIEREKAGQGDTAARGHKHGHHPGTVAPAKQKSDKAHKSDGAGQAEGAGSTGGSDDMDVAQSSESESAGEANRQKRAKA